MVDDRSAPKKDATLAKLAETLVRAKIKKYNAGQIEDETKKVKLNRRKVLNDDELQNVIEECFE
jgi:DNA-directed RNA polymerase beta' subunit